MLFFENDEKSTLSIHELHVHIHVTFHSFFIVTVNESPKNSADVTQAQQWMVKGYRKNVCFASLFRIVSQPITEVFTFLF